MTSSSATPPAEPLDGRRAFQATRYFPALDGLRAVAVLLLLTNHVHDSIWTPLRGYLGVHLFFVLSGFIITTYLLREERTTGWVSIRGFLIRRAFRILPLYLLALAIFTIAAVGFDVGSRTDDFSQRLPYFLTLNGEFAGTGAFSHSWTLGIEEKFYVVWPLLAFAAVPLVRYRGAMVALALMVAIGLIAVESPSIFRPSSYFGFNYGGQFVPILCGCAVALALDRPRSFLAAGRILTSPVAGLAVFALAVWVATTGRPGHIQVAFSFAAAPIVAAFVLRRASVASRALSSSVATYVGRRSYAAT